MPPLPSPASADPAGLHRRDEKVTAMDMRKSLIVMGVLLGLLALTACSRFAGRSDDGVTYRYAETDVLYGELRVKKTVYRAGKLKLYYSGTDLSDSQIRCYDANFEDLGDDFKCGFQKGVLTIRADFAERISGLMIRKSNDSFIFQLRYLDSEQFAWLAQVFAYDEGWSQYGDAEAYYSAEERKALEDKAAAERQRTAEIFALLEGTWRSEDGMRRYEFAMDADNCCLIAEELWFDAETQEWYSTYVYAESASKSWYFDESCEEWEELTQFVLVNRDHSAANMSVIYEETEKTIRSGDDTFYKDQGVSENFQRTPIG